MQNSYNKEKIISKDNLEPRLKVINKTPKYLKYKQELLCSKKRRMRTF